MVESNSKNNIDIDVFLEKYIKLIDYIYKNKLIDDIAKLYEVVFSQPLDQASLATLNNGTLRLFEGNLELMSIFNDFMMNILYDYPNKTVGNSEINARLKRLRAIYFEFYHYNRLLITEPFNIKSISTSILNNSQIVNLNILRNDSNQFSLSLNFNTLLNLINQLTEAISNKYNSGNNAIDIKHVNDYLSRSENFKNQLLEFKETNKLV